MAVGRVLPRMCLTRYISAIGQLMTTATCNHIALQGHYGSNHSHTHRLTTTMNGDKDQKLKQVVFNVDAEGIEPSSGESRKIYTFSTFLQHLRHKIQLETEIDKDGFRVWTNAGKEIHQRDDCRRYRLTIKTSTQLLLLSRIGTASIVRTHPHISHLL